MEPERPERTLPLPPAVEGETSFGRFGGEAGSVVECDSLMRAISADHRPVLSSSSPSSFSSASESDTAPYLAGAEELPDRIDDAAGEDFAW